MKIAVGSDHAALQAKNDLIIFLRELGHDVIDAGTHQHTSVDYPDFAEAVAKAVVSKHVERGILLCGTGIGMCIAANKMRGIRAALCHDEFTAEMSRRHNDANILCAGARVLPVNRICDIAKTWLNTPFEGERHTRRVEKIMKLEQ